MIRAFLVIIIIFTAFGSKGYASSESLNQQQSQNEAYTSDKLAELIINRNVRSIAVLHRKIDGGDFEALNLIEEKANKGELEAIMAMARIARDPQKAIPWLKLAANRNDSEAEMTLGHIYANGKGVKKDEDKAFEFMLRAAKKGEETAQTLLARFYYDGIGTEKNNVEAFAWGSLLRCAVQPIEFSKDGLYVQNLSLKDYDQAKKFACKYYDEYLSPHLSDEEKQKLQKMHNAFLQKSSNRD